MKLQFSDKQKQYMREADARWNFKVGAVRSGKSFVDTASMIPYRIRERSGDPGIVAILGVSSGTVERNVLQPMREIYGHKLIGQINNKNIARVCGEKVYCLGAEKISQVSKIQGASIKYCYGDEVAKWSPDVFQMLKSRLDKENSCFDGALNPEGPRHWLKEFIDDPKIDIYKQHYTIFDNPFLPKKFVDGLCKEYAGSVFYKRLILGEWALAEGLVYNMFSLDDHIVTGEIKYNPRCYYYVSIDYGTVNPFAALLIEYNPFTRVSTICKELYYKGRSDAPRVDNEAYYKMLCDLIGDINIRHIIIDPSAASMIQTIKKYGRYYCVGANNDVQNGIMEVTKYLNMKMLKVHESCKNVINEFHAYSFDSKKGGGEVVKEEDHAMDAIRYYIYTEARKLNVFYV